MATLITLSYFHHFLIQIMLSVTQYNTPFVGCICLQDVLSLSVDNSETACNLRKEHFARKLGESCSDAKECLTSNPNSTCNQSKNVCECKEGYMEVLNTCTKDRQLLNEVCENYIESGINNHEQTDIQNNCSTLHPINVNPSKDKIRTNNTGIIVAVALAGILFGVAVSASVFFFMIRRLKKSQNRQMGSLEDMAIRKQNVQVSGDVKSSSVVGTNRRNTEENGIYNHLHEDHVEFQDQSDYDHCPPQDAPDDMYSHLDSGHDNSEDYMGDYGEIN
uniref:Uncharacterized protein LOC111111992 isoform X2 n=1 Tax=Crassostrea virginica TaxID=6565 RepID=A0A8B8BPZ2_CRAVI|nr:uncharacterized protein LOC111111992 isoform X2 [Crassostrea virginica]